MTGNKRYEVGRLEFTGAKEITGEGKNLCRVYGAPFAHNSCQEVKYIVTEVRGDNGNVVTFDSMNLNGPEVNSHNDILRNLHPECNKEYWRLTEKICEAYGAFKDRLVKELSVKEEELFKKLFKEGKGIRPDDLFKDSPEYIEAMEGSELVRIGGGFVSFDYDERTLRLYGISGRFGLPSRSQLEGLASIILERANKLTKVEGVIFENEAKEKFKLI